jgi:elongation factor Ts
VSLPRPRMLFRKFKKRKWKILSKLKRQESKMTTISATLVKQLREKTGAGMMDCKQALVECDADMDKAVDFLRKKGLATAQKRAGRAMTEGTVQSYIHMGGKLGVMVEVNCETDFVAKNEDFLNFAKNIAMHIAATNPLGIRPEDVPEAVVNREKEIYQAQALEMGKPENVVPKIVEGKMNKFFKDNCLLNQPYVRDPELSVEDLLNELIAKIGENISIRRFARYQTGEDLA